MGINLNFAPVIDVNNNPQNPIIGIRSFANNREIVSQLGKASLEGFKSSGIIPCIKHFPGHGDVTVDSHEQLPTVNKNLDQLKKLELFPFINQKAITPMIMTAHILFPQLDKNHCATLSSFIIQKILRDDLKFNGVVITDSLTMKGVTQKNQHLKEISVQALEAGNDILLIGGRDPNCTFIKKEHVNEVIRAYKHLLNAVKNGKNH